MEVTTHQSAWNNFAEIVRESFQSFRPPEDITVSEWARRNRVLPKGTTAFPGPFHPELFQIQLMDVILDPNVHEIVFMKSTQVGGSDAVANNVVGYHIDVDPKPMMIVQPTIDNAKKYGIKRLNPMIEACPALRSKIRIATSRRSGNTQDHKEFPGGFLKLTGANSGSGLRSDPVPIVIFDEVDAYPLDVDGEGDPMSLGSRRTDTFADFKIWKISTPAKPKGISPIEKAYLRSDQRRFYVPCPFCNHMQVLLWRDPAPDADAPDDQAAPPREYRLYYEVKADGDVDRNSVAYICAECKKKIPERYKRQMMNLGQWIAKYPGRPIAGFHINALYSPWRENWADMAQEWVEAQHDPGKLKVFINLRLGETWEEDNDAIEVGVLRKRAEKYGADVPKGVGILTASVDVQADRLECVVKGWGDREESWLISYQQFFGDPEREEVWNEVDEFLKTEFTHVSGAKVRVRATMIDSGGSCTDSVYRFVKVRQNRRIWACKGSSESGKEILGKFSLNNQYRVKLWSLGTDTAKDRIFARMKIPSPGPGFMHVPDWIDDEYLAQLTSEKAIRRYKKNRGAVREYVKIRARNEGLDLEVYAMAALYSLGAQVLRELKARAELLNAGNTGEIQEVGRTERSVRHPGIS
jgi:phage terminase large subunit GpA-like protein